MQRHHEMCFAGASSGRKGFQGIHGHNEIDTSVRKLGLRVMLLFIK